MEAPMHVSKEDLRDQIMYERFTVPARSPGRECMKVWEGDRAILITLESWSCQIHTTSADKSPRQWAEPAEGGHADFNQQSCRGRPSQLPELTRHTTYLLMTREVQDLRFFMFCLGLFWSNFFVVPYSCFVFGIGLLILYFSGAYNLLFEFYRCSQLLFFLSLSGEFDLNFWATLELRRPWERHECTSGCTQDGYITLDGIIDLPSPLSGDEVWFKEMCLGVKMKRGRTWWLTWMSV